MSEREPIGQKLRFEVFKRDSFTCQYCGRKAPDVILHVDHINPVSKGGGSDILNLVTACAGCNGGKGARLLSDNTEIEKQRAQLEELNERRQQLEWMLEWRQELSGFEQQVVERITDYINLKLSGDYINDTGRRTIQKWLLRFTVEELLSAVDKAMVQYIEYNGDEIVFESAAHAFSMIPRIAGSVKRDADKPWMRDVYYVRATLRNRLNYVNEREVVPLAEEAVLFMGADWTKEVARSCRSWTQFRETVREALDEGESD